MKLSVYLFLIFILISVSQVFAQDSGQAPSDSGVLVSSTDQGSSSKVDFTGYAAGNNDASDSAVHNQHSKSNSNGGPGSSNSPQDDIVTKSTDAVMSQITENMKLTSEQISSIEPIVENYTAKVWDLEQQVKSGAIDAKAMNDQREQLTVDENIQLSRIFTPDQMKVWINIENP